VILLVFVYDMNMIRHTLNTPSSSLSIEEQLEIRKLGVLHTRGFKLQHSGKNQNWPFSTSLFDKKGS
jgi:hypothetical protein